MPYIRDDDFEIRVVTCSTETNTPVIIFVNNMVEQKIVGYVTDIGNVYVSNKVYQDLTEAGMMMAVVAGRRY